MLIDSSITLLDAFGNQGFLEQIDLFRAEANRKISGTSRSEKGQFFTSTKITRFMASLFSRHHRHLKILDAGAGVGSLSAAIIAQACEHRNKPEKISVTVYEIEPILIDYLNLTFKYCESICQQNAIEFAYKIIPHDFIEASIELLNKKPNDSHEFFNAIILNPPYKKINKKSNTHHLLHNAKIETGNMYSAFFWLAIKLLSPDGEIVTITPRSFCNGPYFFAFREFLLNSVCINQIHVFHRRDKSFQEDDVLQENVIFYSSKEPQKDKVVVSSSEDPDDELITIREVPYHEIVNPDDKERFIHIVPNGETSHQIKGQSGYAPYSLFDLGISVSTGKIVDFRFEEYLQMESASDTVPLIYPNHFSENYISWPKQNHKKPNAIKVNEKTKKLLIPSGWYVLVKRFSAKEEKRRIVAALYNPLSVGADLVGIENHLNYFHKNGQGLLPNLAKGLAAFLNSTLADEYFRQFSGHTQVNATDLRNFKYPSEDQLLAIGENIGSAFPNQYELDNLVIKGLGMETNPNDLQVKIKIEESLEILRSLHVPKMQINQRSALTLLALLDIKPDTLWGSASNPLYGITEMMDYFRDNFGVTYAPNTRETVRRQTIHQFVQMGLVIPNPDNPNRPVNSPKTRYQIESSFLELVKTYGSNEWKNNLELYSTKSQEIGRLQEKEREMALIPVKLPNGQNIKITAGGQNVLIKEIIEEFCPRFTAGGAVIYLGDAGDKFRVYEKEYFESLGIDINEHSKMPDVVVHLEDKNWLVLIEAVTSHGPIDIKRHHELRELFKNSKSPLVFVTTFPTRKIMVKYLQEIAWETDVWVAEAPSHLIHFNGDRFLGPYTQ